MQRCVKQKLSLIHRGNPLTREAEGPTQGCGVLIFCGILSPTKGFKNGTPTPTTTLNNPQTLTPG